MDTPKFSPGPWHIRFGGTSEDSGFTVASRDKAVVAEHWPPGMLPEERATINANARLVAAAPAYAMAWSLVPDDIKGRIFDALHRPGTEWVEKSIDSAEGRQPC